MLLFISSCTSDELLQDTSNISPDGDITKVTAILPDWSLDIEESRTSITTGPYPTPPSPVWVTGDSIGIYPDTGGDQLSFRINEGGSKTCTFDGGGWAMKSSSYTAYSPFKRSYYYKNKEELPISMLGQTQNGNDNADHLGAYDIQIAKGEKPEAGSLIFKFSRKVALVRMEITAPKAATWTSVSLESDALFTTEATMNLSLPTPTLISNKTANSVTLSLANVVTTSENLNIIAYIMLLPIDLTNKQLVIKLTDDKGNDYRCSASVVNHKTEFTANSARWVIADFNIPYLTFTANQQQGLMMSKVVSTLQYSVNNGVWNDFEENTGYISFGGANGSLRLRGKSLTGTATGKDYGKYAAVYLLNDNVEVTCQGDIRTLVDYEVYETVNTKNARFCNFFNGCKSLISAPELPATDLADYCYAGMFQDCSALVNAPELPATDLADYCYDGMFHNCSALTNAPDLPATNLASHCYAYMFYSCSNLTGVPELPAASLADYCYFNMFANCVKLTVAPELPATDLADYCYAQMFDSCFKLATVQTSLPAKTLATGCYLGMFGQCSVLTAVPELPAMTLASKCYSSMFQNCKMLTTAPTLPATTLANECYSNMFGGCRMLSVAPELPAKVLTPSCYAQMFYNCTSLNNVVMLATNINATNSLNNWLYNVGSFNCNITISANIDYKLFPEGSSGIPTGWMVYRSTK